MKNRIATYSFLYKIHQEGPNHNHYQCTSYLLHQNRDYNHGLCHKRPHPGVSDITHIQELAYQGGKRHSLQISYHQLRWSLRILVLNFRRYHNTAFRQRLLLLPFTHKESTWYVDLVLFVAPMHNSSSAQEVFRRGLPFCSHIIPFLLKSLDPILCAQ